MYHYDYSSSGGVTEAWYRLPDTTAAWTQFIDLPDFPNLVSSPDVSGDVTIRHGAYKILGSRAYPPVTVYLGGLVVADNQADAEAAAFQ